VRSGRNTTGWLSRREAVTDVTILVLAFLFFSFVAVMLVRQAGNAWLATHGHGVPGTWTATNSESGAKRIDWYGDFTSAGGGPTRHRVPLDNNFVQLRVGQSLQVRVQGTDPGHAFATSQTWEWLPLALIAAVSVALAVIPPWLLIHHLRRSPELTAR
jgi:hypothetical protein